MSGFDYSKWDRLEISDDEDTFHPNLDKGLNIRVNRITRDRKEDEINEEVKRLTDKGELEKAAKIEAKRPLHVDNVCHVAEERTIIQSSDGSRKDRLKKGEEFSVDEYTMFKEDNQGVLDRFTNADWTTSEGLLKEYGHILMEEYANSYYMLEALNAEMRGDRPLMQKLVRQGQILSQIHQLAEPMKRPPRDLVPRFFEWFEHETSRAAFEEGVKHFENNLVQRAVVKKKEEEEAAAAAAQERAKPLATPPASGYEAKPLVEAMYEMTKEERIAMAPQGLDPVEVFESLPEKLQKCFKTGDVELLKEVAEEMPEEEFDTHFQRTIDSGLWRPG